MGLELDGSRLVGAVGGPATKGGAPRVEGVAAASLPESGGEPLDAAGLAPLIAEIHAKLPNAPRRVRLGVAGPDTAMRRVEVPHPRRRADLEAVVAQEAEQRVPIPLGRAHWTSRLLGSFDDAEGVRRARVLIAAAKHEAVDPLCAAAREAGFEVVGVDLSAFAAIRALPSRDGVWLGAILAAQTTLFVANRRECLLTRAPGNLTGEMEEAGGGAPAEVAERLALEIRKTCKYQATLDGAAPVTHVVLTGAGADDAELVGPIADGVDVPVSVEAPAGRAERMAPARCGAAVAAGLCVEEVA